MGVLNTLLNQVECPRRKIVGQSALSVELAAKRCDEQARTLTQCVYFATGDHTALDGGSGRTFGIWSLEI